MTWQEIKDDYAREQGYEDFNSFWRNEYCTYHLDELSLLRAKHALENARHHFTYQVYSDGQVSPYVDKDSIVDVNNIPK